MLSRTQPNLIDLLVAIFAGFAGSYAVVDEERVRQLLGRPVRVNLWYRNEFVVNSDDYTTVEAVTRTDLREREQALQSVFNTLRNESLDQNSEQWRATKKNIPRGKVGNPGQVCRSGRSSCLDNLNFLCVRRPVLTMLTISHCGAVAGVVLRVIGEWRSI